MEVLIRIVLALSFAKRSCFYLFVGKWVRIGDLENKEGNNINNNSLWKASLSSVFSLFISLSQIRSSHPAYDLLRFSQLGPSRLKMKKKGYTSSSGVSVCDETTDSRKTSVIPSHLLSRSRLV